MSFAATAYALVRSRVIVRRLQLPCVEFCALHLPLDAEILGIRPTDAQIPSNIEGHPVGEQLVGHYDSLTSDSAQESWTPLQFANLW